MEESNLTNGNVPSYSNNKDAFSANKGFVHNIKNRAERHIVCSLYSNTINDLNVPGSSDNQHCQHSSSLKKP